MTARASAVVDRAHKPPGRAQVKVADKKPDGLPTAADAERIERPYRDRLEERFGRPLDQLKVYSGPAVEDALQRVNAVAAARDDCVYLADPNAPLAVVAHEV